MGMAMASPTPFDLKMAVGHDGEGNYASTRPSHENPETDQGLTLSPKMPSTDFLQGNELAAFGAFTDAELDAFLGPVQVDLLGESLRLGDKLVLAQELQNGEKNVLFPSNDKPSMSSNIQVSQSPFLQYLDDEPQQRVSINTSNQNSDDSRVCGEDDFKLVRDQAYLQGVPGRCNGAIGASCNSLASPADHQSDITQQTYLDDDCHSLFTDVVSSGYSSQKEEQLGEKSIAASGNPVEGSGIRLLADEDEVEVLSSNSLEQVSVVASKLPGPQSSQQPPSGIESTIKTHNESSLHPRNHVNKTRSHQLHNTKHNRSSQPKLSDPSPLEKPLYLIVLPLIIILSNLRTSPVSDRGTIESRTTPTAFRPPSAPEPDRSLFLGFDKLLEKFHSDLVFRQSTLDWTKERIVEHNKMNNMDVNLLSVASAIQAKDAFDKTCQEMADAHDNSDDNARRMSILYQENAYLKEQMRQYLDDNIQRAYNYEIAIHQVAEFKKKVEEAVARGTALAKQCQKLSTKLQEVGTNQVAQRSAPADHRERIFMCNHQFTDRSKHRADGLHCGAINGRGHRETCWKCHNRFRDSPQRELIFCDGEGPGEKTILLFNPEDSEQRPTKRRRAAKRQRTGTTETPFSSSFQLGAAYAAQQTGENLRRSSNAAQSLTEQEVQFENTPIASQQPLRSGRFPSSVAQSLPEQSLRTEPASSFNPPSRLESVEANHFNPSPQWGSAQARETPPFNLSSGLESVEADHFNPSPQWGSAQAMEAPPFNLPSGLESVEAELVNLPAPFWPSQARETQFTARSAPSIPQPQDYSTNLAGFQDGGYNNDLDFSD
ncbi:hypothetical protein PVAG01_03709 [Phlyctema vagabunda]|uniref:Uncharacterized protein n=1 Tax=Phlyctema vagabunda TaxID=108571 RepID=A0ABR4PM56_9HELO